MTVEHVTLKEAFCLTSSAFMVLLLQSSLSKNENKTAKEVGILQLLVLLKLPLAVLLMGLGIVFIPVPKTDVKNLFSFFFFFFTLCTQPECMTYISNVFIQI